MEAIENAIVRIEASHDVRVLLAAETGSRIDGTARPDSDYDVKGFFVRSVRSYLSLRPASETIRPDPSDLLDVALVDVRRFLVQVAQGNPPALDAVFSPVVYRSSETVSSMLIRLHEETFSPEATASYFRSTAYAAFAGALRRGREAQGKEIGYAIRNMGRHAWTLEERRYPRPGSDMILDDELADGLRWIDARRELPVPDLTGRRFDDLASRIRTFLEAHAGRRHRSDASEPPASADEILFALVGECDAADQRIVPGP